jgi:putative NADH-flavin reductase
LASPPARLTVFGPTGGVGRQLLGQALDAGHEVTVLARDPSRVPRQDPRLTVVAGDVTDSAAVARTVRGSDAVLVADHEAQEALLQDSDLDWTAVRPPFLTDGPRTGRFAYGFGNDEPGLTMKVSRADVAAFMLAEVAEPRYLQQAVGISYRVGAPAA